METQERNNNIPENEVNELREQLALFKKRLDQQEIINDRLMRRSMNARLSFLTKTSVITDIIGLLLLPILFVAFSKVGVPWYFGGIMLLMVIIELVYNIYCHRQLQRLFTDGNDLLTVRRGLLRFKHNERLQMIIEVPLIIIWFLAISIQQGITGSGVSILVGGFIGLLIAFGFFAWEMHRLNHSIREIDELQTE